MRKAIVCLAALSAARILTAQEPKRCGSELDTPPPRLGEAHDQVLRTDRVIGIFLDSLYRLRDSSRVVVVLAADHGFTTIPEIVPASVSPHPLRTDLDFALATARTQMTQLKIDTLSLDVDQQIVLVDRPAFARVKGSLEKVIDTFRKAALQTPGVLRVDRLGALRTRDTLSDPIARRWVHQFEPGTNVEMVVTLEPGSLWNSLNVATHDSPYDIDSHVPVIFYGAGFARGKFDEFVRTVDIAPTLARLLGIKPTEPLDGVPLVHAFAQQSR